VAERKAPPDLQKDELLAQAQNFAKTVPPESLATLVKGNTMRAKVNDDCIVCELCQDMCPDVFKMGDGKAEVQQDPVDAEHEETCRKAAEDCPTDAIEIEE